VKPAAGDAPPADTVPWQVAERPPLPNGLSALLGQAGADHLWLNLADAPPPFVAEPRAHDWQQLTLAAPQTLPLTGIDLLVYLRRLTPSRLLPYVAVA
jgi:hypothetical protein